MDKYASGGNTQTAAMSPARTVVTAPARMTTPVRDRRQHRAPASRSTS